MVVLHIFGGLLGLTSGAVALSARKGSRLHRLSGMVFVYTMSVMSLSGAVMAARMPERISMIAGMLTFYLIVTALLTVRRYPKLRWMSVAAMLFGVVVGLLSIMFAIQGLNTTGNGSGLAPMGFFFGAVALLSVVGDARMLVRGIQGKARLVRHLWRMSFALWIAAASFFLGQSDEFPEALRIMPLLCTPVLLVLLLMVYWACRVSFTQWRPNA